jgi:hypothetical protein
MHPLHQVQGPTIEPLTPAEWREAMLSTVCTADAVERATPPRPHCIDPL